MALYILPNVDLFPQHPIFAAVRLVVVGVFDENNYDCFLTAGYGGNHRDKSRHYSGLAEDYAPSHAMINQANEQGIELISYLADKIANRLPRGFDVVPEAKHIHIEYDPRSA